MNLTLNDVTLLGTIDKIGELRKPSYSMIEIILNIPNRYKDKNGKWANKENKVAVTFFNQQADEISLLSIDTPILIKGEASTRFREYNGTQYPSTSIMGKKYQVIANYAESTPKQQAINLEDFNDDVPF